MQKGDFTDTAKIYAAIENVRAINEKRSKEAGHPLYYYSFVMGCQMNAHDSEKLSGMLRQMGYRETYDEKSADFIIYNTCTIRENAEHKLYGKLGYLKHYKKKNPNLTIALCGCMMQRREVLQKIISSYSQADIIFGTFNLHKLPEYVLDSLITGEKVIDIWEEGGEIYERLPVYRNSGYKASVNIMYGCDNFCSYCVVPYVRGRERSREPKDILSEVWELAGCGIKEIMLLGQNVNSYGKTLRSPVYFPELLRMVNEIPGIERIRFMTSHPKDLSMELIYAMRDCKNVCGHLHLPVQSGSTKILNAMNRRYTRDKYLEQIYVLKKEIPNILISTDIIVGFPGETEEDFQETLDLVKKCRFSNAFTFIYSRRSGTPAAEIPDNTPEDVIKERFGRLLNTLNKVTSEVLEEFVGKTLSVVPEGISRRDENILTGRAENNLIVHFLGNKELIGKAIPIKITGNKTFYLIGERASDRKDC